MCACACKLYIDKYDESKEATITTTKIIVNIYCLQLICVLFFLFFFLVISQENNNNTSKHTLTATNCRVFHSKSRVYFDFVFVITSLPVSKKSNNNNDNNKNKLNMLNSESKTLQTFSKYKHTTIITTTILSQRSVSISKQNFYFLNHVSSNTTTSVTA